MTLLPTLLEQWRAASGLQGRVDGKIERKGASSRRLALYFLLCGGSHQAIHVLVRLPNLLQRRLYVISLPRKCPKSPACHAESHLTACSCCTFFSVVCVDGVPGARYGEMPDMMGGALFDYCLRRPCMASLIMSGHSAECCFYGACDG